MSASRTKSRYRQAQWLVAGLGLAALGACSFVDPIRWGLPMRYLIGPLDIYRDGFIDFKMCMRVAMSPREAEAYVNANFAPKDHVARAVPMEQALCPAAFWPENFAAPTMGHSENRFEGQFASGTVQGSSGAAYQNGYLYFWSNDL